MTKYAGQALPGGMLDATTQQLEQGFFSLVPFLDSAQVKDGELSIVSVLAGNTGFAFEPAS